MVAEYVRMAVQLTTAQLALNATAIVIEIAMVVILGVASSMMQFYAAMSLGYGFTGIRACGRCCAILALALHSKSSAASC